jgi:CheY-like chemotaxis protein
MILVIDDETEILDLVGETLKDDGHLDIIKCTSSISALNIVESNKIDICITDLSMPCMNGAELLTAIKKKIPDMKIIIISGYSDLFASDLKKMNITNILNKPFRSKDLIKMVTSSSQGIEIKAPNKRNNLFAINSPSRFPRRIKPTNENTVIIDIMGDNFIEVIKVNDISIGGTSLIVPHRFKDLDTSKEVGLILTLPNERPFKVTGKIRHQYNETNQLLLGIEFTQIFGADIGKINNYIEDCLKNFRNNQIYPEIYSHENVKKKIVK